MRAFGATRRNLGWWEAFRRSKDPPAFIVLFEDSAAILGILAAAAGTTAALVTGDGRWDGVASLLIAVILAGVAVLLAQEIEGIVDRRTGRSGGQRRHPPHGRGHGRHLQRQ